MKAPTYIRRLEAAQNEIRKRGLMNIARGNLMDLKILERIIAEDNERIKPVSQ